MVEASNFVGEAPEITYHDDLFPEGVFLQEKTLHDDVPHSSGQWDVPVSL